MILGHALGALAARGSLHSLLLPPVLSAVTAFQLFITQQTGANPFQRRSAGLCLQ